MITVGFTPLQCLFFRLIPKKYSMLTFVLPEFLRVFSKFFISEDDFQLPGNHANLLN